jgi:hypothetical protein
MFGENGPAIAAAWRKNAAPLANRDNVLGVDHPSYPATVSMDQISRAAGAVWKERMFLGRTCVTPYRYHVLCLF